MTLIEDFFKVIDNFFNILFEKGFIGTLGIIILIVLGIFLIFKAIN